MSWCFHCFSLPPAMQKVSYFSTSSATLVILCAFPINHPMGLKWCHVVILICISLMIGDVEHFFMCLLAICLFLEKCLLKFDLFFVVELWKFFLFWMLISYLIHFCKYFFSSISWVAFLFCWSCPIDVHKFLNFKWNPSCLVFILLPIFLVSYSRNHWQIHCHEAFLLFVFFPQAFYGFSCYIRSSIRFELILVGSIRVHFHFFASGYPVFPITIYCKFCFFMATVPENHLTMDLFLDILFCWSVCLW